MRFCGGVETFSEKSTTFYVTTKIVITNERKTFSQLIIISIPPFSSSIKNIFKYSQKINSRKQSNQYFSLSITLSSRFTKLLSTLLTTSLTVLFVNFILSILVFQPHPSNMTAGFCFEFG